MRSVSASKGLPFAARIAAVLTGVICNAAAQGVIETLAIEGTPAPDGNGHFGRLFSEAFGPPVINAAGQVAFAAFLTNTAAGLADSAGLYLFDGVATRKLARGGDPAPSTQGKFSAFKSHSTTGQRHLTLNDAGQVGALASISGDPLLAGVCGGGLFRFGLGGSTLVIGCGMPDPRNLGGFGDFGEHGLDALGRMAFQARVKVDDFNVPVGVFVGDESGFSTVLLAGDPVPNGGEAFTASLLRGMNPTGDLLIFADDTGDEGGLANESIYVATADGLRSVVANGMRPPDENGVFEEFQVGALNSAGLVAFTATLGQTTGGRADDSGLFLATESALFTVAREGARAPNGGNWINFQQPVLNDRGTLAFLGFAGVTQTVGSGIYVATTNTITLLVPARSPAPDGQGTLSLEQATYPILALNNRGQVLFQAGVSGGPSSARIGVFLADPDGTVRRVVRRGQELEGSTVNKMELTSVGNTVDAGGADLGRQRPLNDTGQVAFWAELADGRDGVFRWSPPAAGPVISGIRFEEEDVVVQTASMTGHAYQLQSRAALAEGEWQDEGDRVAGTDGEIELREVGAPTTAGQRYYRVAVVPAE